MSRYMGTLIVLLASALHVQAADAEAKARAVAPFVDERTVAVFHADLTRLDVAAVFGWLGEVGEIPAKDLEEPRKALHQQLDRLQKAGARDVYLVVSMEDVPNGPPFAVIPLADGADASAIIAVLKQFPEWGSAEQRGQAVVAGTRQTLKRLATTKPAPVPNLAKAFAAAGDTVLQGTFILIGDLRRSIEETLPKLPEELGGGSTRVLTRGVQWAAVGVDLPPKASLRFFVQSADAAAAQALHDWVGGLFTQSALLEYLPVLKDLAPRLTPQVAGDQLTLTLDRKTLVDLARPLVKKVRVSAEEMQLMNQFKQIGIAQHSYVNTYGTFPAWASYDKQKKPLLSWRVHLLPFIEQDNLYKQFHLDEPWDSEHNKKLIAQMPKLYAGRSPTLAAAGKTTMLVPLGDATIFPVRPEGMKILEITDGTSNTILAVEAGEESAVIWTRPDDLKINPDKPAQGLANPSGRGFMVLMADGSVQVISPTVDKKTLWAAFTRNGGEVIKIP